MSASTIVTSFRRAVTATPPSTLALLLLFLSTCSSAWARLGETPEEIAARYGAPTHESKNIAADYALPAKCFSYFRRKNGSTKFGTHILVTFRNDKCVREEYRFIGDDGQEVEIKNVMELAEAVVEANSAGKKWEFIPIGLGELGFLEFGWLRSDEKASAMVTKQNKKVLEVADLEWGDEEAAAKQRVKAGVGGF